MRLVFRAQNDAFSILHIFHIYGLVSIRISKNAECDIRCSFRVRQIHRIGYIRRIRYICRIGYICRIRYIRRNR
ncbi:hypothetical protein MSBR3_0377 [Methanosarcina barkeri 3]|uniref:Uncharacterized protein n=1 Tax=Methanosarcina barkeri 3 TaxID=1434107 RepID=A0A0E3WVQ2_METBA|nr:hypothetical protein MSBR3_0377 [Methanosarcina barkeri 3]